MTTASTSPTDRGTRLRAQNWDFPASNRRENLHSIHPYPGRFIPEIPRMLIQQLGVPAGTVVLDPFCGSGTSLTEAQQAGHPAVGIDLNPIGCLISRVKTRPMPFGLATTAEYVVRQARQNEGMSVPIIPNLDHWFETAVQQGITRLLAAIAAVPDPETCDVLRAMLSSVLVRVSNQESDTRYAAVARNGSVEEVYTLFDAAVQRFARVGPPTGFPLPEARVIEADILTVTADQIAAPVGLVVTSPPYPNAYEYWLYHKYRMFWLGYDPLAVKAGEIGARAHYFKKNAPAADHFLVQLRQLFALFAQVVVPGGHVCMVVGRSKIHGELIDNAAFVQQAAQESGFTEVAVIERRIAASRKSFNLAHAAIAHEHLLVFTH